MGFCRWCTIIITLILIQWLLFEFLAKLGTLDNIDNEKLTEIRNEMQSYGWSANKTLPEQDKIGGALPLAIAYGLGMIGTLSAIGIPCLRAPLFVYMMLGGAFIMCGYEAAGVLRDLCDDKFKFFKENKDGTKVDFKKIPFLVPVMMPGGDIVIMLFLTLVACTLPEDWDDEDWEEDDKDYE